MTDSKSTTAGSSLKSDDDSALQKTFEDFRALAKALLAGDLSAAQHAFAAFECDMEGISAVGRKARASRRDRQADRDYQILSDGLEAGNLTAARRAFADFLQDLGQTSRNSDRRQRRVETHGGDSGEDAEDSSSTTTGTTRAVDSAVVTEA